jgi:ketosteroid isomerase-like protein
VRDHPHIEVFRRTYAAFTTGDMDALAELSAEDVVWHTRAATHSRATKRAAMPPSRPSPESSSCRVGHMRWSSMTS